MTAVPADGPERDRSGRATHDRGATSRLLALGGLAVGAVLALVAGSRPWWRAAGTGVSVSFPGTEATAGLAQALALVVLAGALLGLVLRARGRRVLGVLLALAGAGVLAVGLSRPRPASGTVRSRVLEVSLADQFALVGTPWPYVYALAGLVVLAAAGLTALTAPGWPTRASRYERPAADDLVVLPAASTPDDDPGTLWRQLDAGVDPTDRDAAHTVQPPAATPPNPSRHDDGPHPSARGGADEQPSGVTMKSRAAARTDDQPT